MPEKNYTSKVCTVCKTEKPLSEFYKHKNHRDGFGVKCRLCSKEYDAAYRKTREGVATVIYCSQRRSSNRRGHKAPNYTNKEFSKWLFDQSEFHRLYDLWVESGYKKMEKPSVDRLDDYKTYTFNNLQIMTWKANKAKGHSDRKAGINNKHSKPVIQLTKEGVFVNEYYSANKAARDTGIDQSHISGCCNGKGKTAGGFKWMHGLVKQ